MDAFSTGPLKACVWSRSDFAAARDEGRRDSRTPCISTATLPGGARSRDSARCAGSSLRRGSSSAKRFTLNARASPTTFQKDHFDAEASILLNPYQSWFEAHADLFAQASGRTGDLSRLRIRERLDANVAVARFEDLVAFLAGRAAGEFSAPLAALRGGLMASFSARGDPTQRPRRVRTIECARIL